MSNPISQILVQNQVEIPQEALDLSAQLRERGVIRPYVLVMTGRCGSTWLASALSKVPGFGNPVEYFSEEGLPYYWNYDKPQSFSEVFLGIAQKYSDQGKFGFKINPQRLFWINQLVDLPKTFPMDTAAWIDMRRWNVVKQALSFVQAKKTGLWHSYKGGVQRDRRHDDIEINDIDVWREILNIVAAEQEISEFYSQYNIVPLRIWYEEIFDSKSALVIRVLKFIDAQAEPHKLEFDGDTDRLNHGTMINTELAFTNKYGTALNEIYTNRGSLDLTAFRDKILCLVTGNDQ